LVEDLVVKGEDLKNISGEIDLPSQKKARMHYG
jgi:hypothetical protein